MNDSVNSVKDDIKETKTQLEASFDKSDDFVQTSMKKTKALLKAALNDSVDFVNDSKEKTKATNILVIIMC